MCFPRGGRVCLAALVTDEAWSRVEQEAAQALDTGDVLDLTGRADTSVRAGVVRDLLPGCRPPDGDSRTGPDPRGLRLHGATVTGRLDLDHVHSQIPSPSPTATSRTASVFVTPRSLMWSSTSPGSGR